MFTQIAQPRERTREDRDYIESSKVEIRIQCTSTSIGYESMIESSKVEIRIQCTST